MLQKTSFSPCLFSILNWVVTENMFPQNVDLALLVVNTLSDDLLTYLAVLMRVYLTMIIGLTLLHNLRERKARSTLPLLTRWSTIVMASRSIRSAPLSKTP